MPTLKMYIANILIDKQELDYSECESVVERELYQLRIASYLYWIHIEKHSWRIKEKPVFFIDVDSKMNDRTFETSEEAVIKELEEQFEI